MGFLDKVATGGLIGGIANIASTGIQAWSAKKQQETQIQHDKDMARLNDEIARGQMQFSQDFNKENMSIQNQYQLDQWNRENAYNDPGAVRARYEAAGISPQSAFGQGSASGSGISGGLSSAPSGGMPSGSGNGHSSNIMTNPYGGLSSLGSDVMQGLRLSAENKAQLSSARLAEVQANNELFDRLFIKPSIERLKSALADEQEYKAEIAKLQAQWEPYLLSLRSAIDEQNYNSLIQGIKESEERMKNMKSLRSLNDATRDKTYKEIEEISEKIKNYGIHRLYQKALTDLAKEQKLNTEMDSALKKAQTGHYDQLKRQIDKEIEFIGSKIGLNEQQIKKMKHNIAQGWVRVTAQVSQATSQEIREWMYGFIPGRSSSPPVDFNNGPWVEDGNTTYMFAD